MKQGKASRDGRAGWKVEPTAKAINPKGVSQIGQAMGNKVTERGKLFDPIENVFEGRGYEAPMRSIATHKGGSQGRH